MRYAFGREKTATYRISLRLYSTALRCVSAYSASPRALLPSVDASRRYICMCRMVARCKCDDRHHLQGCADFPPWPKAQDAPPCDLPRVSSPCPRTRSSACVRTVWRPAPRFLPTCDRLTDCPPYCASRPPNPSSDVGAMEISRQNLQRTPFLNASFSNSRIGKPSKSSTNLMRQRQLSGGTTNFQ